ncbi:uncharacterized protein BKA78DRAFT_88713 [Phyllosticta capitalensis]|uniref:uncharacterized protein n=1 Tax=Phyllosticta capitalensis TaxID=121624 RepID=UPI00312F7C77
MTGRPFLLQVVLGFFRLFAFALALLLPCRLLTHPDTHMSLYLLPQPYSPRSPSIDFGVGCLVAGRAAFCATLALQACSCFFATLDRNGTRPASTLRRPQTSRLTTWSNLDLDLAIREGFGQTFNPSSFGVQSARKTFLFFCRYVEKKIPPTTTPLLPLFPSTLSGDRMMD